MSAPGKRVSWVELYLDLIFVLAVGGLAHVIEEHPEMRSVWIALGLFVTLWWTWIGFAVLYNRYGADRTVDRLVFLAGSIPAGVSANPLWEYRTEGLCGFQTAAGPGRLGAWHTGDGRRT